MDLLSLSKLATSRTVRYSGGDVANAFAPPCENHHSGYRLHHQYGDVKHIFGRFGTNFSWVGKVLDGMEKKGLSGDEHAASQIAGDAGKGQTYPGTGSPGSGRGISQCDKHV